MLYPEVEPPTSIDPMLWMPIAARVPGEISGHIWPVGSLDSANVVLAKEVPGFGTEVRRDRQID